MKYATLKVSMMAALLLSLGGLGTASANPDKDEEAAEALLKVLPIGQYFEGTVPPEETEKCQVSVSKEAGQIFVRIYKNGVKQGFFMVSEILKIDRQSSALTLKSNLGGDGKLALVIKQSPGETLVTVPYDASTASSVPSTTSCLLPVKFNL